VSTNELDRRPLRFLIDFVGKDRRSTLVAGGRRRRSRPLIGVFRSRRDHDEASSHTPERERCGGPRLSDPSHHAGLEGNLNIKCCAPEIRQPALMTRWETDRYTQLLANGKAMQFNSGWRRIPSSASRRE